MTYTDQGAKMPEPVPSEIPVVEEEEGDPAPKLTVVPIEDLDKVEKLLDVARNTVDMPNLPHIKAACMQELAEIDAAMGEAQAEAEVEYQKELAEWSAKREAERVAKAKEELAARKKAEAERRAREEEAGRDPDAPQTLAGVPRDSLAHPIAPTGPSPVYPQDGTIVPPQNGTIERRV
jgi:hypothetical protein